MKLFAAIAASASANTILAPLYESIAGQIKSTAVEYIRGTKDIAAFVAVAIQIEDFAVALEAIPNSELVDLMEGVDITTLTDADGNFNADALATVFNTMDPAVVDGLKTSFVNNLDPASMESLTTSMEYFTELSETVQDLMNNEIEVSNFIAIYNDVAGALVNFNDAFGGELMGSSLSAIVDYGRYATVLAEKAMIVYEESGVLMREFSAAQRMIEFSVNERINEMDGAEGDGFMCRAGQTGVMDVFAKTFEYAPDAIVANAKVPVIDTIQFYNDFVHGLPFGISETAQVINVDNIEAVFDQVDSMLLSISGSITEIGAPLQLATIDRQIDNFVMNTFC